MKQQVKVLSLAVTAALALSSAVVMADSSSGYDNTVPINNVTAQTEVDIDVLVPKVILLRVGLAGTGDSNEDKVTLTGSVAGMTAGNNKPFTWSGAAAPTFTVAGGGGLLGGAKTQAWAWTNSSGGGNVTCNTIGAGAGIAGDITVASVTVGGGGIAHPGATTACGGTSAFAKHVVASSTWQYGMTGAAMSALDAGTYHLDVYYTATSL